MQWNFQDWLFFVYFSLSTSYKHVIFFKLIQLRGAPFASNVFVFLILYDFSQNLLRNDGSSSKNTRISLLINKLHLMGVAK